MNELKSFLNSKTLRKSIKINGITNFICTKTRLESDDISSQNYCQFKEIPSDKILSLINQFTLIDDASLLESLFPMTHSWTLNSKNERIIKDEISNVLSSLKVSDFYLEKMIHCLDELVSNSLFAANPELKSEKELRGGKELRPLDIRIYIGPEYYALVIRDQHGLFDKTAQLKTFGKEFNSQSTINRKPGGGAGVGLHIVREICNLLIFRQKSHHWIESAVFFVKNCNAQSPLIFKQID